MKEKRWSAKSQRFRSWTMARWRRIDKAARDTCRGGRGDGRKWGGRSESTGGRYRICPRYTNSYWGPRSFRWKRRDPWENPGEDLTWRQGGRGLGSSGQEWGPWSADGSWGWQDDAWSSCKTKKGWSSQRAGKMISDQRNVNILPQVFKRTHNPAGFYSEEWDELQKEDD